MSASDAKPEWKIGQGRPRGVKNKRTQTLERLIDDSMQGVIEAMIASAMDGDVVAQKAVVALRVAPRKDNALPVQLPLLGSPADATACALAVASEVLRGKLTPSEGQAVLDLLAGVAKIAESGEIAERLATLEKLALRSAAAGRLEWGSL